MSEMVTTSPSFDGATKTGRERTLRGWLGAEVKKGKEITESNRLTPDNKSGGGNGEV